MMAADTSLSMVTSSTMMVQKVQRFLRCWLLWY
jgi:hypothetical protein